VKGAPQPRARPGDLACEAREAMSGGEVPYRPHAVPQGVAPLRAVGAGRRVAGAGGEGTRQRTNRAGEMPPPVHAGIKWH
jgi:hypothetical protein